MGSQAPMFELCRLCCPSLCVQEQSHLQRPVFFCWAVQDISSHAVNM